MDKVIELEEVVSKRSPAFFSGLKSIFTTAKYIGVTMILLVGVDLAKKSWADGVRRFEATREAYISDQVAKSLAGKTLNFDDKKGVAKLPANMSREELMRALYLVVKENDELAQTLEFVASTVNYGRQGGPTKLSKSQVE